MKLRDLIHEHNRFALQRIVQQRRTRARCPTCGRIMVAWWYNFSPVWACYDRYHPEQPMTPGQRRWEGFFLGAPY